MSVNYGDFEAFGLAPSLLASLLGSGDSAFSAGTIASAGLKGSARVGNLELGSAGLPGVVWGSTDSEAGGALFGSTKTSLLSVSLAEPVPFHSRGGNDCPV